MLMCSKHVKSYKFAPKRLLYVTDSNRKHDQTVAGGQGLRKKIKRGGSTVIWKWKGGHTSAPENDFAIPENDSETGSETATDATWAL